MKCSDGQRNEFILEFNYLPGDCDLSRGLGGVGGFWVSPVNLGETSA